MAFDISDTLAPASDQLDAIELASGPRIFEIERVTKGNTEQPINIHFKNFPRPWRPSKGMRRILAYCWSTDASTWAGRKVELFFDPEVTFGKDKPGGTRISRLSHIDKPTSVPLLVSRGKSATFTVQPLPDEPPTTEPTDPAATRVAELRAEWKTADPERRAVIEAEVLELTAGEPS